MLGSLEVKGFRCSEHLDALRGVAAILVLFGHLRNIFFVDHHEILQSNLVISAVYFLTSLGHQSVVVFFVLSGLLISSNVLNMVQSAKWTWTKYLVNRLARLLIVLVPALVLCAALDGIGISMFGTKSIYGGESLGASSVDFRAIDRSNIQTFIGNLFFLQGIAGIKSFGSDAPLWSLSYEFWYYLLFPLLLLTFYPSQKTVFSRIKPLIVAGLIACGIGPEILRYFFIWLIGTSLLLLPPLQAWDTSKKYKLLLSGLCLSPLPLVLFGYRMKVIPSVGIFQDDLVIGLACGLFIYGLLQDRRPKTKGPYSNICHFLANFSYTLYLVHMPLLFLLRQCFLTTQRWQPDTLHFLLALLIAAAIVFYAQIVARLTEYRTALLRQALTTAFCK